MSDRRCMSLIALIAICCCLLLLLLSRSCSCCMRACPACTATEAASVFLYKLPLAHSSRSLSLVCWYCLRCFVFAFACQVHHAKQDVHGYASWSFACLQQQEVVDCMPDCLCSLFGWMRISQLVLYSVLVYGTRACLVGALCWHALTTLPGILG